MYLGMKGLGALLVMVVGGCGFGSSTTLDLVSGVPAETRRHSLLFDGVDDQIKLRRPVKDSFTIELWVRTTDSLPGDLFFHGAPLVYADVAGLEADFGTSIANSRFVFGTGLDDRTVRSQSEVNTGDWVHLAATREASTGSICVFVNGMRERCRDSRFRGSLDAPADIYIGANLVDRRFVAGNIDEVRMWDLLRTEKEIHESMNSTLDGTEPGLAGYWRFDDADSPDRALDSSRQKNHGWLAAAGAPSFSEDVPASFAE